MLDHGGSEAFPLDMVNGTVFRAGNLPPFNPDKLLLGLEVLNLAGFPPKHPAWMNLGIAEFPNRCTVTGDLNALLGGEEVRIRLQPRISIREEPEGAILTVSGFPPNLDPSAFLIACQKISSLESKAIGAPKWKDTFPVPIEVRDSIYAFSSEQVELVYTSRTRSGDGAGCHARSGY